MKLLNDQKINYCWLCKRRSTVWHLKLFDDTHLQLCAPCMASVLVIFLKELDEKGLEDLLLNVIEHIKE
jgi:hypothetical protein